MAQGQCNCSEARLGTTEEGFGSLRPFHLEDPKGRCPQERRERRRGRRDRDAGAARLCGAAVRFILAIIAAKIERLGPTTQPHDHAVAEIQTWLSEVGIWVERTVIVKAAREGTGAGAYRRTVRAA